VLSVSKIRDTYQGYRKFLDVTTLIIPFNVANCEAPIIKPFHSFDTSTVLSSNILLDISPFNTFKLFSRSKQDTEFRTHTKQGANYIYILLLLLL